jgi:hypothetical protein
MLEQTLDVALLADKLVPFRHTRVGCYEEGMDELIEVWTKDFSVQKVKWLNKPSHQKLAMVHGAVSLQRRKSRSLSRCDF